jgi:hypothetical protein
LKLQNDLVHLFREDWRNLPFPLPAERKLESRHFKRKRQPNRKANMREITSTSNNMNLNIKLPWMLISTISFYIYLKLHFVLTITRCCMRLFKDLRQVGSISISFTDHSLLYIHTLSLSLRHFTLAIPLQQNRLNYNGKVTTSPNSSAVHFTSH